MTYYRSRVMANVILKNVQSALDLPFPGSWENIPNWMWMWGCSRPGLSPSGQSHWRIQPPVLGGGGATWSGVPPYGTPKTENSTDLTHYFLGWTQIHFRKKNKIRNKFFESFWGAKQHDGPPSWALGDHGRVAPPWIRQWSVRRCNFSKSIGGPRG